MRGAVVDGDGLIDDFFQFIGRTINNQAQFLLDPPVKSLNLPPALGMIGCTEDVFDPVLGQILGQKLRGEAGPVVRVELGHRIDPG